MCVIESQITDSAHSIVFYTSHDMQLTNKGKKNCFPAQQITSAVFPEESCYSLSDGRAVMRVLKITSLSLHRISKEISYSVNTYNLYVKSVRGYMTNSSFIWLNLKHRNKRNNLLQEIEWGKKIQFLY